MNCSLVGLDAVDLHLNDDCTAIGQSRQRLWQLNIELIKPGKSSVGARILHRKRYPIERYSHIRE